MAIPFTVRRTYKNVAANTVDSSLVTARTDKKIVVLALHVMGGNVATTSAVLNSKGSGAGTACSPVIPLRTNDGPVLPFLEPGWYETNVGEGLTVTSGAGDAITVSLLYRFD